MKSDVRLPPTKRATRYATRIEEKHEEEGHVDVVDLPQGAGRRFGEDDQDPDETDHDQRHDDGHGRQRAPEIGDCIGHSLRPILGRGAEDGRERAEAGRGQQKGAGDEETDDESDQIDDNHQGVQGQITSTEINETFLLGLTLGRKTIEACRQDQSHQIDDEDEQGIQEGLPPPHVLIKVGTQEIKSGEIRRGGGYARPHQLLDPVEEGVDDAVQGVDDGEPEKESGDHHGHQASTGTTFPGDPLRVFQAMREPREIIATLLPDPR